MRDLESHFEHFRRNIVGHHHAFATPYGQAEIVYADWTASGRLYAPIERRMLEDVGPFVGNTHSESNVTGASMSLAYDRARQIIKAHVNAGPGDVLLFAGYGMTSALHKLQRILELKVPDPLKASRELPAEMRPIVFVTHMEHHSNHTTWLEALADVVVIAATSEGLVDLDDLRALLLTYQSRKIKIGAFTACSNVTGIETPYRAMARLLHEHGGVCFVDFAASAPYVTIDMHPADPRERLDAVTLSPHKFLGGPGASGVLVFDADLYRLKTPDQPGGGTVLWTNPWGEHRFSPSIEVREDGGTPGFLQAIRGALAVTLKDTMGVATIERREREIVAALFRKLRAISGLTILADNIERRLGIFSFYFDRVHYNLVVRLLNDRFGIQARGGCSCAGTYGHYLLNVGRRQSKQITDQVDTGDLSTKPGWVRLSTHPTTTDEELDYVVDALRQIRRMADRWGRDYRYDPRTNEFSYRGTTSPLQCLADEWFTVA
jgi:selenocysteine lyase/cysteine desulfurase